MPLSWLFMKPKDGIFSVSVSFFVILFDIQAGDKKLKEWWVFMTFTQPFPHSCHAQWEAQKVASHVTLGIGDHLILCVWAWVSATRIIYPFYPNNNHMGESNVRRKWLLCECGDWLALTSPTSISYTSTPRPHQSTALVYDVSVSTSGAKNSGVPQNVLVLSP